MTIDSISSIIVKSGYVFVYEVKKRFDTMCLHYIPEEDRSTSRRIGHRTKDEKKNYRTYPVIITGNGTAFLCGETCAYRAKPSGEGTRTNNAVEYTDPYADSNEYPYANSNKHPYADSNEYTNPDSEGGDDAYGG